MKVLLARGLVFLCCVSISLKLVRTRQFRVSSGVQVNRNTLDIEFLLNMTVCTVHIKCIIWKSRINNKIPQPLGAFRKTPVRQICDC